MLLAILWTNATIWFTFIDHSHVLPKKGFTPTTSSEEVLTESMGVTRLSRQTFGWLLLLVINTLFAIALYFAAYHRTPPIIHDFFASLTAPQAQEAPSSPNAPRRVDDWTLRKGLEELNAPNNR